MKTIAVLIDFSDRSEHAAKYALHLAKKIKANVLLFNAFLVPADMPMVAAQVAWPAYDYDEIKADSEKSLKEFAKALKHDLRERHLPGVFLPGITCQCEEGPLTNATAALQANTDIILLVAGTHGSDAVVSFVLGNNCRQLIDDAKLPLLLVPENAPIRDLDHIIFATDLDANDINYINAVAGLAQEFTAEVIVANVNPETGEDVEHNKSENAFMLQMVQKVSYRRVSFRNIKNQNVNKGLVSALKSNTPDMLVMVHRKTTLFDVLFRTSATKKFASYTTAPLLVYSYPMAVIPQF